MTLYASAIYSDLSSGLSPSFFLQVAILHRITKSGKVGRV